MKLACRLMYPENNGSTSISLSDMVLAFNQDFYCSEKFTSDLLRILSEYSKNTTIQQARYKTESNINSLIKNNILHISNEEFPGSIKIFGTIRFYEQGWQEYEKWQVENG